MDTSGFYKLDEILLFARYSVYSGGYELLRENYNTYIYPVDGWYWFDSEEDARIFFNLPPPEPENTDN
ncbi:MAG: hypothetical protein ACR2K1_04220 [Saprospiraceae bacterium]